PDGITLRLRTNGISQLVGRLSAYDYKGTLIGTVSASNSLDSNVTFQLTGVKPYSRYYVKVESYTGDANAVGAYRLEVDYRPLAAQVSPLGPRMRVWLLTQVPDAVETQAKQVWFGADGQVDDTLYTARTLSADPGFADRAHYQAVASLFE